MNPTQQQTATEELSGLEQKEKFLKEKLEAVPASDIAQKKRVEHHLKEVQSELEKEKAKKATKQQPSTSARS
jgi:hypothetical protein